MPLEVHELALALPEITGERFDELVEDIKERGLLERIVLYEGKILDGRNRYRACLAADVEPLTTEYDGDEPASFVLSKNLHRRHLSDDQRAMIGARLKPAIADELKAKADQARSDATRAQHAREPGRWPIEHRPPQRSSRQVAGEKVGVSGRRVDRAARVQDEAPDLATRVGQDELTLAAAERELEQRSQRELEEKGDQAKLAEIEALRFRQRYLAAVRDTHKLTDFAGVEVARVLESHHRAATEDLINRLRAWCDQMEEALKQPTLEVLQ